MKKQKVEELITQGEIIDMSLAIEVFSRALVKHEHTWTKYEREVYETAMKVHDKFQKKFNKQ
ncbi:MAG: hypothetical protein ABIJ40_09555 [Bacteroidota bacterium]